MKKKRTKTKSFQDFKKREKIIIIDEEGNIYINAKYSFDLYPASWKYELLYGQEFNGTI